MRSFRAMAFLVLGLMAAAGAARAETVTVSVSPASVDLGNLIITSSPAQIKVTAGSGAVSVVSGSAVRIKTNGASPANVPAQTVTVSCSGPPSNCKNTYRVTITSAGVTGNATSVTKINVANLSGPAGVSFSAAPEASPGQIFTINSSANSFTVTFTVGATTMIASTPGHTASWSYNVQVAQ
jgi:hypothetical protein